ncbi:9269_t:CDS:2 [Funneliformis caledonium]|uniref:9269_t:CDS:1 n=1 Tax=Funneliformis caledonium TaxID=1117310 RepID=A0A9N8YMH0_9GLOM|nr:9269_t:CDS:2 [Funneliformis caledonium]
MEFYQGLSLDFSHLLDESDDYDVIIYAGKEPNVKKFHAHTVILRARSPYFRRALSRDWARKENGSIVFQKPNIAHEVFDVILKYIYSGTADLLAQEGGIILNLLTASDELNLQELIVYAQDHLIQQKSDWLQENVIQVLHTVGYLEACKDLQNFCLGLICQDPYWLFESNNFCSLDESVLVPLLKRDDLLMEEIEIWDHLIEWGIAQNISLNENISTWTPQNFETLKGTLEHCIPLIRYFNIDSSDYWDKLRPFRQILPSKLHEDLLQYYCKRGNISETDTLILSLRKTDSSWSAPTTWTVSQRSRTSSFDNMSVAVFSSPRHGPCFGQTDLRMNDNFNEAETCTCQCYDYESEITENHNFSVEEYEVFQVINKDIPESSNQASTSQMLSRPELTNYPTAW